MKIFFKFFTFILMLSTSLGLANNFEKSLSDGHLEINGTKTPVKIFATTSGHTLDEFSDFSTSEGVLIFLNEELNTYANALYPKFISLGYQALNKNFTPTEETTGFKYLYKPKNGNPQITADQKVNLNTEFSVWNPSKGINLGFFTLHFYSLMFVFAFGFGSILMAKIFKIDGVEAKYLDPLATWTIIGTIFGARIGHVLFYQPELIQQDFWAVFLPFRTRPQFEFTGFSGLASHGATIALILTTLYYSFKIIKKNPLWVYDRLGIVVALGGMFVRMGNFFNSEIIGKPANPSSPFAVFFPQMSDEYGITIPRYPTQIFEAVGYLLLFFLLWYLYKYTNKKYQQGWLFGVFFTILWSIRFFVEFLKEPQGDEFISFAGLNTGQVLSLPFILIGIILMFISKRFKTS